MNLTDAGIQRKKATAMMRVATLSMILILTAALPKGYSESVSISDRIRNIRGRINREKPALSVPARQSSTQPPSRSRSNPTNSVGSNNPISRPTTPAPRVQQPSQQVYVRCEWLAGGCSGRPYRSVDQRSTPPAPPTNPSASRPGNGSRTPTPMQTLRPNVPANSRPSNSNPPLPPNPAPRPPSSNPIPVPVPNPLIAPTPAPSNSITEQQWVRQDEPRGVGGVCSEGRDSPCNSLKAGGRIWLKFYGNAMLQKLFANLVMQYLPNFAKHFHLSAVINDPAKLETLMPNLLSSVMELNNRKPGYLHPGIRVFIT